MLKQTQIDSILAVIEEANQTCLKIYGQEDFGVQIKSDNSPVTQADLEVNEILTTALKKITPDIPVVSEEANPDFEIRKNYNKFWIIDPIDGTKEFIKKSGEFTINLGLVENGYPIFGVIAIPCQGEVFYGGQQLGQSFVRKQKMVDGCFVRGYQSFKICAREAKSVNANGSPEPETIIVDITCSKDHRHPDDWVFIEKVAQKHYIKLKPCGSTIKICRIAEGEADIYVRMSGINDWDLAAGHAIVEAAGGSVVDINGNQLLYNTEGQRLNPFIVFGKTDLDWTTYVGK